MASINYDVDKVISMCEGQGSYIVDELVSDVNRLIQDMNDCQIKFHAKGYKSDNAINQIYKGFSNLIGYSRGDYYGEGIGGLVSNSAKIINTVYEEALEDKRILEAEKAEEARLAALEAERQRIGNRTFRY